MAARSPFVFDFAANVGNERVGVKQVAAVKKMRSAKQ